MNNTGKQHKVILMLIIASFLAVAINVLRSLYVGNFTYWYLIWNLFLAWIPLLVSILVHLLVSRKFKGIIVFISLFVLWLLFFPNAYYITTDFIHLSPKDGFPFLFDLYLILLYSLLGLFIGYLSLFQMQMVVKKLLGRWVSWVFVFVISVLTSVGIYLGRFLRLNSWDVLVNPGGTFNNLSNTLSNLTVATKATIICSFLTVFFIVFYILVFGLSNLKKDLD